VSAITRDPAEHPDEFDFSVTHSPTLDVIQDYPTAWDWRLVLGFVLIATAIFYL